MKRASVLKPQLRVRRRSSKKKPRDMQRRTRGSSTLPAPAAERFGPIISAVASPTIQPVPEATVFLLAHFRNSSWTGVREAEPQESIKLIGKELIARQNSPSRRATPIRNLTHRSGRASASHASKNDSWASASSRGGGTRALNVLVPSALLDPFGCALL